MALIASRLAVLVGIDMDHERDVIAAVVAGLKCDAADFNSSG